jgi:hypothetical protein
VSFDVKCYELAETFIDDDARIAKSPELVAALAQEIQDTIEAFLQYDDAAVKARIQ